MIIIGKEWISIKRINVISLIFSLLTFILLIRECYCKTKIGYSNDIVFENMFCFPAYINVILGIIFIPLLIYFIIDDLFICIKKCEKIKLFFKKLIHCNF